MARACDWPDPMRPACDPDLATHLRAGKWRVTMALRNGTDIIAVWPGLKEQVVGVAIDVGSTTMSAHLCDMVTGDVLASTGAMNPQIRFGEDLMSQYPMAL